MKNFFPRTSYLLKLSMALLPALSALPVATSLLQSAAPIPSVPKETSLSLKNSIVVDNKVLASVRGHVITVYDIMKKLDMVFYRQFPEYRSSVEARLEFYRANWRLILKDAIDRELAQAYAEEKQFVVSNGDVREELEDMFGPDVMMNLYDAGLSLYDVNEMLKADILLRRLLAIFVRAPVMATITPEKLRAMYEERMKAKLAKSAKGGSIQEIPEEWTWQAITLTPKAGREVSKGDVDKAYDLLMNQLVPAEALMTRMGDSPFEISISQPFSSEKAAIAPQIVQAIIEVPLGAYTRPVIAQSRNSQGTTVWKMYKLIEKKALPQREASYAEVEPYLREEIAAPLIDEKTKEFFQMLRKQYGVHMTLTEKELETFEPFRLNALK